MKTIYLKVFYLFLLIPTFGICQYQNVYTLNLKNAEELYSSGQYEEAKRQLYPIIIALNGSIGSDALERVLTRISFSKDEIEKIHILLTQIYIETGDEDKAKASLVDLYKESPNFSPGQLYQRDFYRLIKTVEVQPKFYAGISIGLNKPFFKVTEVYSIYDSTDYAAKYKSNLNYSYTGFLEWQFIKNLSVNGAYSYSKMGYERNIFGTGSDQFNLKYNELIYANEARLTLKKYFFDDGFKPFIGAGAIFSNLRQVQSNVELNYLFTDRNTGVSKQKNITQNNIDILELRNKNRLGLHGALGISYKIKNLILGIETRYFYELKQFNNSEVEKYNNALTNQYYYVDNDIKLSRFDLGLSFAYILNYSIISKNE